MIDPFPVIRDGEGRAVQRIECVACGAHAQNTTARLGRAGPGTLAVFFRRRGWSVDLKKGSTCPDCIASQTRARRILRVEKRMEHKQQQTVVAMKPVPTPAASEVIALVYMALAEAYDGAKRDYRPGWTDERIARETKASIGVVIDRRERDFGPLPPPKPDYLAEIGEIARPLPADIADILSTIQSLQDKTRVLAEKARRICVVASNHKP